MLLESRLHIEGKYLPMKSGTCPKCQSEEIYHSSTVLPRFTVAGAFTSTRVDEYVCTDCGYTESFISNPQHLQALRKRWRRVKPKAATPKSEPSSS
jgi:predicted RNA-binding Zn-ribbon protein involved in translation (DUF1610 family)